MQPTAKEVETTLPLKERALEGHWLMRPGAPPLRLEPGKSCTFGRLPGCSVTIASPKVSRFHAEIRWEGNSPILVDHSTYGTLVGGIPIREHALQAGDEVVIGSFSCTYARSEVTRDSSLGGATVEGQQAMLSGTISETSLGECLQSLEFNGKTGTLHVAAGGGFRGWIVFRDGAPFAAEGGELRDLEAALRMLELRDGRFVFSAELVPTRTRMPPRTTVTHILLEAGRRSDEAHKPTSSP